MNPDTTTAIKFFVINFLSIALQYRALAGLAWWLAYRLWKRRWARRKIIAARPGGPQIRREILLSLLTAAIFGLSTVATWWFAQKGWSRFYWDIRLHGVWWLPVSTVITTVLWDAWFYWTHRAMHHRWLFRHFHRGHHLSHNPTPWTTYAVDPLEAAVYAVFVPMVSFLYPVHPLVMALFMTFQFLFNLAIHSGFEIMPTRFGRSRWAYLISTPTSHVMHHETGRGNFGFCFQIWDRIMGTCHPEYDRRLVAMTEPLPDSASGSPGRPGEQ